MIEVSFVGLVGPTHNFAGLSPGNLAAQRHAGSSANPRAAALEGLALMRRMLELGGRVGVLPPQLRPDLSALRRVGFLGDDARVLEQAASASDGRWLALVSSASSMWAANAATFVPSRDSQDGRAHLVVANLSALLHRGLEAEATHRMLRSIFANTERFVVHAPLPGQLGDEGAANHHRAFAEGRALHLFGYGRAVYGQLPELPRCFSARQTLEASEAVARLSELPAEACLFWQQAPGAIDRGAFHSDVLCMGSGDLLLAHELAFVSPKALVAELRRRVPSLRCVLASEQELPLEAAVASYVFNAQLIPQQNGRCVILAPDDIDSEPRARAFLERAAEDSGSIDAIETIAVRQSMKNGGGPACLRLRVQLTEDELSALRGRVLVDAALLARLETWVQRHYRDRLALADLGDPKLLDETRAAHAELIGLLELDLSA